MPQIRISGASRERLRRASRSGRLTDGTEQPDGSWLVEVDEEVYSRLLGYMRAGDTTIDEVIEMLTGRIN